MNGIPPVSRAAHLSATRTRGRLRERLRGTRAAGDVGPYHAPHPVRTLGRARRPRRAARTGTPAMTPLGTRAAEDVGPYHAPRPVRALGRARRPRRAAHTGTPAMTPSGTRAAGDVGPYHAPHPARAPGRARRPRRAAHTGTTSWTPTGTRAAGTSAPTMPRILSAPLVGRDVPGAPRTRGRQRERPRGREGTHRDTFGDAGRRGRRPLPCPASCPHPW